MTDYPSQKYMGQTHLDDDQWWLHKKQWKYAKKLAHLMSARAFVDNPVGVVNGEPIYGGSL